MKSTLSVILTKPSYRGRYKAALKCSAFDNYVDRQKYNQIVTIHNSMGYLSSVSSRLSSGTHLIISVDLDHSQTANEDIQPSISGAVTNSDIDEDLVRSSAVTTTTGGAYS